MVHQHSDHQHAGHEHSGHHHHRHAGGRGGGSSSRALTRALVLTLLVLVAELVGGWLSNSLALLADAGHVFTDAGALGLSLFVTWLARQPGNATKTYGYLRWEILAAFINGATLLIVAVAVTIEAITRMSHPPEVAGGLMFWVATAGLVVNAVAALMLHSSREGSLNVRGAYLHVVGDLLASVGTVAAAVVIRLTGYTIADPIASLLCTLLIVVGAWQLVRESVDVLLEGAPPHISLERVRACLETIPGVESVHDLHVWTVTSGVVAMSAHAICRTPGDHQEVLEQAHDLLQGMGIHHVTMQIERTGMQDRELHLHP